MSYKQTQRLGTRWLAGWLANQLSLQVPDNDGKYFMPNGQLIAFDSIRPKFRRLMAAMRREQRINGWRQRLKQIRHDIRMVKVLPEHGYWRLKEAGRYGKLLRRYGTEFTSTAYQAALTELRGGARFRS